MAKLGHANKPNYSFSITTVCLFHHLYTLIFCSRGGVDYHNVPLFYILPPSFQKCTSLIRDKILLFTSASSLYGAWILLRKIRPVNSRLILPMCYSPGNSFSPRPGVPLFFANFVPPSRKCRLQRLEIGKQQIIDAARLGPVGAGGEKVK